MSDWINPGRFRTQIDSSWTLLQQLALDGSRAYPTYPADWLSTVRHLEYRDVYRKCYSAKLYDLMLADYSLLQFHRARFQGVTTVCYAYYECPFTVDGTDLEAGPWQSAEDVDMFYDTPLASVRLKASYTPIRYDYSPSAYNPGLHPASHVHIGLGSQVRLGTVNCLLPTSFVLFVLRQAYPIQWKSWLESQDRSSALGSVRDKLTAVPSTLLSLREEMHLH